MGCLGNEGGGRTIQIPAWAIMAVPVGWRGGLVVCYLVVEEVVVGKVGGRYRGLS